MVKQKVLILGGGFGGIKTALQLAASKKFEVSLMSDKPDFRYFPALYKAATGGKLTASAIPLAEIFKSKEVNLIADEAKSLDRAGKQVAGASGKTYGYDLLVVALGSVTNYFNIAGLKEHAYGIKSIEEATRLRDHLHKLLLDEGKPDLNYVIIGGGPTGVELAGALPGYLRHIMKRHGIKKTSLHIDLIESAPRLMPRMPESYSKHICRRLKRLGVELYLGQTVEAQTADELKVSGHSIASHTVVWTAGVSNNPFIKDSSFKLDDHGKAVVNEHLMAEDNTYIIGDNAATPYSGMAQTALYDAEFVAGNLIRVAKGKTLHSYKAKEPSYVTPVGPRWAAAMVGPIRLYGWLGMLLRNAADFSAYHEVESWGKASQKWVASKESEKSCQTCGH